MVSFYLPWHGSSKYFLLLLKKILSLHRDVEIKHIVIIFMIFNWQSVLVYCVLTVKRVKGTQSLMKWFPKRSHGMFKIVNSTNFSSISWELEQFHVQSNYLQLHSKFTAEWNGFREEEKTNVSTSHSFERHSNYIPCLTTESLKMYASLASPNKF